MNDYDELLKLERVSGAAITDLERFDRVTSSDKAAELAVRMRNALRKLYFELDEVLMEEADSE